jgi:hypothetical protein
MLTVIAYGLAIVLNLFLVDMGSLFLLRPRPSAAGYGVPVAPDGDTAYLAVKGVRESARGGGEQGRVGRGGRAPRSR